MSLRTYFFLTLRYVNPFFRNHIYPYDWKTWDYWKRGLKYGLPFPLFMLISIYPLIKIYTLILPKDSGVTKALILASSIVISYACAKKLLPKLGRANQYDLKCIDMQLVLMTMTLAWFSIMDLLT